MRSNSYTLNFSKEEKNRLTVQAQNLYGGFEFIDPFLKKNISVLDAGCGSGITAEYVSSKNGDGNVLGIDFDAEKIRNNLIKYKETKNLKFEEGNIYELNCPDSVFDLCYTRFVLMHLKNPIKAIKEIIRVTRPGGTIVFHEGIHDAVWIYPRCYCFEKCFDAWKKMRNKLGQDHSIGLKINTILNDLEISEIQVKIIPQLATYGEKLFDTYIDNLRKIFLSLSNSLKGIINKEEISLADKELLNLSKGSLYLELTAIVSGIK